MTKHLEVIHLGRLTYAAALKVQQDCTHQLLDALASSRWRGADVPPQLQKLLLVEHEPVYTIGIRQKTYSWEDVRKLEKLGADFHYTNRGGLITFHGPGQLVAYPILYLKHFGIGMKSYVCRLEDTIIGTCKHFGVKSHTSNDTGVWIGDNKIAAIGVHGSRYVTSHGLALNCNTDLSWFDHIVPCGLEGKGVTSLSKETGRTVTIEDATKPFIESFAEHFHCMLEDKDTSLIYEKIQKT